jgi:hypothetical protein
MVYYSSKLSVVNGRVISFDVLFLFIKIFKPPAQDAAQFLSFFPVVHE